MGVLKVPDSRLEHLTELHESRKTTPATIEFVLIPGLVKAGDQNERLDLAGLRNVDVLVHVVRAFDNPAVAHPAGSVDASRDIELLELELILADLSLVEKRLERIEADTRKGNKADPLETRSLEKAREALAQEKPVRAALDAEDRERVKGYALLTAKPVLLVVNVDESSAADADIGATLGLEKWDAEPSIKVTGVSAQIESEIAQLPDEDAIAFREDIGLSDGAVERLVRAAFELMGVITFYTAGDTESRAWVIAQNTGAAKAAGTIHSDMERGFIRAEVVDYDTLVEIGSWNACRDKGQLRLEGKDYPIAEADVVFFRFNV